MSMKSTLDSIYLSQPFVARTAPVSQANGLVTIFTITGGLVYIWGLLIYHDTVVATAQTVIVTINGVPMDAGGAVAINGAAGSITIIPLGAVAIVAPTLAGPIPTLLGAAGFFFARVAGPVNGLIACTFAAGPLVAPETISWRCLYSKIDPAAMIA
jgi:hypothetical protein